MKAIFWREGDAINFMVTAHCDGKPFASPTWAIHHTAAPPLSVVRAAVRRAKAQVAADIKRWNTALDTK